MYTYVTMYLYERSQTSYLSHCKPESIDQERNGEPSNYIILNPAFQQLRFCWGKSFFTFLFCLDFLPFPTVTCGRNFPISRFRSRFWPLPVWKHSSNRDDPSENRDERSNWKNFNYDVCVFFGFSKNIQIVFCWSPTSFFARRWFGVRRSSSTPKISEVLLMEEILHHLGCIKLCKWWDIYGFTISTGAGFQPSTVVLGRRDLEDQLTLGMYFL